MRRPRLSLTVDEVHLALAALLEQEKSRTGGRPSAEEYRRAVATFDLKAKLRTFLENQL